MFPRVNLGVNKMQVLMKRKREGRTDYRKRFTLLKSGEPRLVVRPSNKGFVVQLVKYADNGDNVKVTVTRNTLIKLGIDVKGNSTPFCYLAGYYLGLRAKKSRIKKAILDTGLYRVSKGGRISAVLRGSVDAGLNVPHDDSIFPSDDRISGKHLKNGEVDIESMKKILEGNK